jgi:3-hydroxyacyl-[acyl-carrier-protein] dehydratase
LDITVKLDSKLDAAAQVSAEVLRGETRVVRALLTFVMKDIPSERIHEQRKSVYRLWTRDFETPVTIL